MSLSVRNWFCSFSNSCVDNSSTFEGFSRVHSHSVINNNKSTWCPPVSALVLFHKVTEVLKNFRWQRGIVSKNNSFFGIISFINPTSVGSDYLIKKGFVSVWAYSYCWQYCTYHSAISVFEPLACSALFCHLFFCIFLICDVVHGFPTST